MIKRKGQSNTTNIFSPTFGYRPKYIVGRDNEISEFMEGIAGEPGHPNRATFFIGQRGMGKTVLLLDLAERSREAGFIVVRVVAGETMLDDIIEGIQISGERLPEERKNPVKSVSAGAFGFSVGLSFTDEIRKNFGFATKLSLLCEALTKRKKGVLFLIDEIRASTTEIRVFATTYQHLVGDGMNVAVAMAGLPNAISSVLNDKILTFLNRAYKVYLNPLQIADVSACYAKALSDLEIKFDAKTLDAAACATDGYPYLLQLVGYHMLKFLNGESTLTETTVELAVYNSKRALVSDVLLPCLNSLSAEDKRFLKAMAIDNEESRVSDIRDRLQVGKSHAQTYRKRLMEAGLIHSSSRGVLAFSIPYLGQYLRGKI
ncbi:MAG: ATP-binding protein [Oscillospiraceae bacterium]|nr:ATP-binding protein [Oscillospiraceae bacterium]